MHSAICVFVAALPRQYKKSYLRDDTTKKSIFKKFFSKFGHHYISKSMTTD